MAAAVMAVIRFKKWIGFYADARRRNCTAPTGSTPTKSSTSMGGPSTEQWSKAPHEATQSRARLCHLHPATARLSTCMRLDGIRDRGSRVRLRVRNQDRHSTCGQRLDSHVQWVRDLAEIGRKRPVALPFALPDHSRRSPLAPADRRCCYAKGRRARPERNAEAGRSPAQPPAWWKRLVIRRRSSH